ncbi:MAG TPA: trigger factor [Rhodanobacteraceae bacterium]|nr:trigger factor [Rhodanobacteraceae bacterium]
MQVSVENVGTLERKLTVTIPADRLEQQVGERLARMTREVRLKGFRPGKVPRAVIEKRFGAQVRGEALSDLIGTSFREAVTQEKLRPAAPPAIDTSGQAEGDQIAYTATFEVMPEVPVVDVEKLTIRRPVAEVAESDVDTMIETLRQQRRSFEAVDRGARDGDMVLFEFSARTDDGRVPGEGLERAGVILGSGQFQAEVEKALVGHAPHEEFTVEASFPEGFRVAALGGKRATLQGTLTRVQEPKLPAVDEAFVKAFGIAGGDVETFRKEVRANLERELQGALMARLKAEVAAKLAAAQAGLDVPKVMVANEARAMLRLPPDAPLSDERLAQVQSAARERVIAGLSFGELARSNQLQVDEKRVAEALATVASTYEEPEQVIELYRTDPQLMSGLRNRVLEDQVAEWVVENADAEDLVLTFDQAIHPDRQAG